MFVTGSRRSQQQPDSRQQLLLHPDKYRNTLNNYPDKCPNLTLTRPAVSLLPPRADPSLGRACAQLGAVRASADRWSRAEGPRDTVQPVSLGPDRALAPPPPVGSRQWPRRQESINVASHGALPPAPSH